MTIKFRLRGGVNYPYHYSAGNFGNVTLDTYNSYDSAFIVEKLSDTTHPFLVRKKAKLSYRQKGRNHWRPPHRDKRALLTRLYGTKDFGGPFSVQRRAVVVIPAYVVNASSNPSHVSLWWDFTGAMLPFATPVGLPLMSSVPVLISNTLMMGKGSIGWNKFKPTHKQVNVGQALGELRTIGGLPISPKMIQEVRDVGKFLLHPLKNLQHATRTGIPIHDLTRLGGSGYLGYQFGIRPYVKDIMDLSKAVLNFDKNIKQLIRDNGRGVRRSGRVSFDETVSSIRTTATIPGALLKPALASQIYQGVYTSDKTITNSLEFWFAGRFRYHLDPHRHGVGPIPDREKYQLQRILYGIDPTDVSLIWDLMPWSWLINWIVPIGPMIDNLVNDRTDHLVADYAYIMGKSITMTEYVVKGQLKNSAPFTSTCLIIEETKQRAKASPYGFGLSFSGFNPRQLAILAALGVSR